jgi:hypothetical protein
MIEPTREFAGLTTETERETFQAYVDNKYNIETLGPYDYMIFIRNMKEVEFRKMIYDKYVYDIFKK